jgi:hypothetical protein
MAYGLDDLWRVWNDLERKADELKWGGHQPGFGTQYNSMGRPANASPHFNMAWADEQMGRVGRLRKALNDSGPMTRGMLASRLSGIDLSTIWHILVSACQDIALYYCGSVATGAFIGGLSGAFFGGVGAVPGAAAGAAAGGYVGGWVLAMLGLKSLVGDLAQSIPEALHDYERGFVEAWGPTRHDHHHGFSASSRGDPSAAAFYFANGHVTMILAILAVLAAYLTRGKGDEAVLLKDISQSPRLGPGVARWVEENKDKLRQHPLLQSRGRGASPREEPPPPKRGREPTKEQPRDTVGDSVRNSKIAQDPRTNYGTNKTGTVWDAIQPVGPMHPGSVIPQKFEFTLERGGKIWVDGNATKHIAEYAAAKAVNSTPEAVRLASQVQLESLGSAVNTAVKNGVTYRKVMNVNNWELIFAPPKSAEQLPALYHALYKGE